MLNDTYLGLVRRRRPLAEHWRSPGANWSRFVRGRRGDCRQREGTLEFAGEGSRAKVLEGKWGQDGRKCQ